MSAGLLPLAGSSVGFTLGSLLLKRFADTGAWTDVAIWLTVFAVNNLLFAQVLGSGLGRGVVVSSMSQTNISRRHGHPDHWGKVPLSQSAGVFLAVLSIFLMLSPGAIES